MGVAAAQGPSGHQRRHVVFDDEQSHVLHTRRQRVAAQGEQDMAARGSGCSNSQRKAGGATDRRRCVADWAEGKWG
jgi:hypothetical protein